MHVRGYMPVNVQCTSYMTNVQKWYVCVNLDTHGLNYIIHHTLPKMLYTCGEDSSFRCQFGLFYRREAACQW